MATAAEASAPIETALGDDAEAGTGRWIFLWLVVVVVLWVLPGWAAMILAVAASALFLRVHAHLGSAHKSPQRLARYPLRAIAGWGWLWLLALLALELTFKIALALTEQAAGVAIPDSPLDSHGFASQIANGVIWGPLLEEFLFRGWLFGALRRRIGLPGGVLLSSLAFALVHGSLPLLPLHFVMGICLACSLVVTGSLWAPIALHMANNAFGIVPPGSTGWLLNPGKVGALPAATAAALALSMLASLVVVGLRRRPPA